MKLTKATYTKMEIDELEQEYKNQLKPLLARALQDKYTQLFYNELDPLTIDTALMIDPNNLEEREINTNIYMLKSNEIIEIINYFAKNIMDGFPYLSSDDFEKCDMALVVKDLGLSKNTTDKLIMAIGLEFEYELDQQLRYCIKDGIEINPLEFTLWDLYNDELITTKEIFKACKGE